MADDAKSLQKKLQEKRKAMDSTLQTSANTTLDDTNVNESDEEVDDNIPILQDHLEEIDENEEANASRLMEKLESRHDATRRRLQRSEIHASPSSAAPTPTKRKEPSKTTVESPGQSQDLTTSPRLEGESTLGSTLGRSTGTKSLRSRLQEKLQAAKQQRSLSPMTDERKRTQRLKDRISSSTRFDDPLRTLSRVDIEKERDLESKVIAKLRWKKARQQISDTAAPTEADCYDFFTKQYGDRPPEPEQEPPQIIEPPDGESPADEQTAPADEQAPPAEEQVETPADVPQDTQEPAQDGEQAGEQEQAETDDDKKKLIADIIPPELNFKLINIVSAEYIGHRARVEEEQKISFVPSVLDAPVESKNLEEATPVYLEEEGFYVGLMPEVQIRNRNILENRILSQEVLDHKLWFGPDGRVKNLPNPVRLFPTKPWVAGLDELDPSIETVYVKAYQRSVEEKYLEGTEEHELQIDVGTIVFHHHPLMSREHVLASKLNELYEAYFDHRQKNYAVFYHEKLRTLRLALRTMKRHSTASPEKGDDDPPLVGNQELHIQDYLAEIRRTCNQRDRAEFHERELIRKMFVEWNEISKLRTVQTFSNTSVKLSVRKQEVNQETDRTDWTKEIDLQVKECMEEYKYTKQDPYKKQMAKYQIDLQEWKKKSLQLKRQRKRAAAVNKETVPQNEEEDDTVVGVNPKPLKPIEPAAFNEDEVRQELINQALKNRRKPGEPKLSIEVANTSSVTPNTQVPEGEAMRRRALQSSSVIAQIKIDGKDVCSSEPKVITSDFQVHFGQIFKIFISQWPDTIKVQLREAGRISNPLLDEVFLSIPDASVNSANVQSFPTEFTNDKVVAYNNHEGVGSSTPFNLYSDTNATPVSLKTRGSLFLSIAWGLSEDGRVLAPRVLTQRGLDQVESGNVRQQGVNQPGGVLGVDDADIAALWSQEGKLDPNDPANSALVTFSDTKEGFVPALDYFRLDQLQEQFDFLSDEEFENARRLKILEYRTKGIAEFRNLTMVPANEHEILDSAFTAYERRKREKDALGDAAEKKVADGALSAHRLEVLRFRQLVRDTVLRRFYSARHYHTLQDMVIEDQVPDIGTLGVNILKTIEPKRPLKPARVERKKATPQNLTEGSVTVLVSVVRAYNLPVRDKAPLPGAENALSRTILAGTAQSAQPSDDDPYRLTPFVSVSFQNNVKTTNIAQGPNPSWNEEVEVPFSAPNNDYSPDTLQTVDDTLFVHIFDRVVTDASVDNRDRNEVGESSGAATGVVAHRIQNHWLGSLRIPFSTIYQRGRIEGTFKLNIPAMMLGYISVKQEIQKLEQPISTLDPYLQMQNQLLVPQEGSFLTVFVTLEPQLIRPDPVPQKFETQEEQRLIDESLKFIQECKKKFPKRRLKTTVIDLKGESVFITRYVKPLPPPASLLEGSSQDSLVTAERLARFVSLIPFVSDNVIYAGICDLWSTCDQFLNMLCGDEEEHAILLVNYFLHIGLQAYLVLGNAVPEGDTAYVLTHDPSQEYLLWNASTGQHYKTTDSLCPLQNVYALVNQDNVWFNMQPHDMPSRMNFNFSPAGWKPLFKSPSMTQGLSSVQPETLNYPVTEMAFVQNLEEKIERTLKDSFMNWRPRHVTRWNRSCSSALRQILEGLETERFRSVAPADGQAAPGRSYQDGHTERLTKLIGDARFIGFPMDMPFTDIDAVVKAVRSTEVHKIQDNDIEFALAVHIHPYPASILCVWVYLAAIHNKRSY